jgi:pimeloyl-ACP methyl ester carboxylesterase
MLGPDSRVLIALLITASAALLVASVRLRLLPVKALCGALSIVVAMTGGIAVVNNYYGYYTSWGQLWADFGGGGGTGNLAAITPPTSTTALGSGRLGWTDLPGKLSGYDRRALVYLPPQYGQPKYAQTRFPVVELFHGTPGTSPLSWDTRLHIGQVADSLIARHLIGPMVLVMPTINGSGHNFQDCLNGPGLNDETYITKDVRADVYARYRVSHDPYEWGLSGYSSGGYCAANLALRHPTSYGAAAVIDGYFRATDGPASAILKSNPSLEAANSPLYLAERLTQNSSPVPAFWVAAGTNDKIDYKPATVFAAVMNRIEQVPFVRLHNVGDTANGWYAALPTALTWLWQHLASPDLRVQFPVRAGNSGLSGTLIVPPLKGRAPGPCVPARRPGPAVLPCGKLAIGQTPKP